MEKVANGKATYSMSNTSPKKFAEELIAPLDITINGNKPWDVQVHNNDFYSRIFSDGALGLGEAYMEKWWDCERLDIFFDKILRARLDKKAKIPLRLIVKQILAKYVNLQTISRAPHVAHKHYDLGNTLFKAMLDKRMIYSCGYWKEATSLDEAQVAKLELICKKLQLKPGMRLLDIGCGWGGLAKYAAENYGVSVVGITISQQQAELAKEYCKGLPIEIRLQDYREINEKFDSVVSVGMFEHVGPLNYDTFMKISHNALSDTGLFLLHTIGANDSNSLVNEWTLKYIFPNGTLPSMAQISTAAEKYFVVEDWHNFGTYYDNTLMAWHENFVRHWDELKSIYDDMFFRMWSYYLLSCAASFRARYLQLWQIVLSKNGIVGGYIAPR